MTGLVEHDPDGSFLDHAAQIEHGDPVGHGPHHCHVVADEQ
jgi:hypothetical protein